MIEVTVLAVDQGRFYGRDVKELEELLIRALRISDEVFKDSKVNLLAPEDLDEPRGSTRIQPLRVSPAGRRFALDPLIQASVRTVIQDKEAVFRHQPFDWVSNRDDDLRSWRVAVDEWGKFWVVQVVRALTEIAVRRVGEVEE